MMKLASTCPNSDMGVVWGFLCLHPNTIKFKDRRRRGRIIIIRNGAKTISFQTSFGDLIIRNGAKTISLQTLFRDLIIILTRFDCVWMQTQKSLNNPHIRIRACGCKFHHYQPIPHFKILLDINFHGNLECMSKSLTSLILETTKGRDFHKTWHIY
jgi:hypothetical protein